MTEEKIIDRIKKLLRLAESDNLNEAANAAARAQALMDKHRIERELVETQEDADRLDGEFGDEPISNEYPPIYNEGTQVPTWIIHLADALARSNQCRVFYRSGYQAKVFCVGRESDVATVRYMFTALRREINRLCKKEPRGMGRAYYNAFRLGAVSEISSRMQRARREQEQEMRMLAESDAAQEGDGAETSTALARLDAAIDKVKQRDQETEDWFRQSMPNLRTDNRSGPSDYDGYAEGRRAGKGIQLGAKGRALRSGGE